MVLRLALVLGWTLICMPVQAILIRLPGRGKERFARAYWGGVAVLLGLRLTVHGGLAQARPVVFVANHCSWLDIVALGAVLPGCFVAKADVDGWPLINLVARLGRTIFVSRARGGVARERADLAGRLAAGDNIILFPEGTTSDGARVLPFSSAFLAIAAAPARPHLQPVTLVYDRLDGLPMRLADRPTVSWYGDMDLAPHYARLGRIKRIHATILLDAPIPPGTVADRKVLSALLEARLAANAAALRQGRFTPDTLNLHANLLDSARGNIAE
jgi:1-acyl-sn-glycerol-3-phosphate acyltransferase